MRSIWAIFKGELRQMFTNIVTIIIVCGLALMPSIFTWYNVLACWNVFDNTNNLTVAVASLDEGYTSSLYPVKINVGETVISTLRGNDQIGWVFVSNEEAMEGVYSGEYYAAIIIPENFSRSMLTFYQDDGEQAPIVYYTNEKLNAIAPKITEQGADGVSYQINAAFAKTLSEVALGLAESINNFVDTADVQSSLAQLANRVDTLANHLEQTGSTLTLYASLASASQALLNSTSNLLDQTRTSATEVTDIAKDSAVDAKTCADALKVAANNMDTAIRTSIDAIAAIEGLEPNYNAPDPAAAAQDLRKQADSLETQIAAYQQMRDAYEAADPVGNADIIKALDDSINTMQTLANSLRKTADDIENGNVNIDPALITQHTQIAKDALERLLDIVDNQVQPRIDALSNEITTLYASLSNVSASLDYTTSGLSNSASSAASGLEKAVTVFNDMQAKFSACAQELHQLSSDINAALASKDADSLKEMLTTDASLLSSALVEPVTIERHALYESENFGSAMLPLYATIGLFVGALLLSVAFKPRASSKVLDKVSENYKIKPRHEFFGHFGIFAFASILQSTILALGSMLFLNAHVVYPFLFLLCYWVSSLVFTFFIYALVVSFANLGKAIAVILLVVQVTGCNGSYPLQILPWFVQAISPFLPATHVVAAMRSAMFGMYANDFWIQMGYILLFIIPALILGLWLRKLFIKFMAWYVSKVEESKMMS